MGKAEDDLQLAARMRPVIERELAIDANEALGRVRRCLEAESCRCTGTVVDKHVELFIQPSFRHFWSPWLSAEVHAIEGTADKALFRGRFGPHPAIWTGFAAGYAICLFSAIAALMYGFSQWMLDHTPWVLALIPVFALLAGSLYAAALFGRRLARDQISWMLRLLDCSLDGEQSCAEERCVACPLFYRQDVSPEQLRSAKRCSAL